MPLSDSTALTKELKSSLRLDPGPEPRRKSVRPISVCRRFCYAFTIISVIITWYLVNPGLKLVQKLWNDPNESHQFLYHNDTQYEIHQVVRPLIEKDQSFDIVATVWIRELEGNPSRARGLQLIERPIFTDTIFRDIKMSKKIYKTSVNLEIPTAAFQDAILGNYDLRGSFVLVLKSPSLIENALGYSSWVPWRAGRPPSRAYLDGYTPTLVEQIADAYGTFTPLLSFHEMKSRCQTTESEQMDVAPPPNNKGEGFDPASQKQVKPEGKKLEITTDGRPVLKAHPHIITRTHLNIMDSTRLYDRKRFQSAHRALSMIDCGERLRTGWRSLDSPPDWRLCHSSFSEHANCQVMIEYSSEGQSGNALSNWAYAPYLFVDPHWGPLDLTAVPVNREDCSPIVEDPKIINMTWNVSFGSISPRKHSIATRLGKSFNKNIDMSDTEEGIRDMHSSFEFGQALLGQRFNQNIPLLWIAWFSFVFNLIFRCLGRILLLVYWCNRAATSTVGISPTGTAALAVGLLMYDTLSAKDFLSIRWTLSAIFQAIPFFMVKALTRAEFVWSEKRWIVVPIGVRYTPTTHAERASQRVEQRTSRGFKIFIFISLVITFYLIEVYDLDPFVDKGARFEDVARIEQIKLLCYALIALPMIFLGMILQIIMNFHSKTFAGEFKLGVFFNLVADASFFAAGYLHPATFGSRIGLHFGFRIILEGVVVCQALVYPKPKIVEENNSD